MRFVGCVAGKRDGVEPKRWNGRWRMRKAKRLLLAATRCSTLHHTASHCITLQHITPQHNTLQHATTHWLERPATHIVLKTHMGWLRLVGSFKLQVSLTKEPYKRDCILQKRLIISRNPLIVATPQSSTWNRQPNRASKEPKKRDYILQNWPAILRSLLIVATL